MFEDRGYDVSEFSESDNKIFVRDVVVYLFLESKVGVNHVKDIRSELGDAKHVVIVYKNSITSFAKQTIQELVQDGVVVEIFKDTELAFNVTRHSLVPKHEKISEREKNDLLKRMRVRSNNLPHIKMNDPVSKYMGLKKGDVVRIHRNSEISETAPSPYIDFGTLVRDVERNRIDSVVIDRSNSVANIIGKDDETYTSRVLLNDSFVDAMIKHDVKVFVSDSSIDYSLLVMFFPFIFYFIIAGVLRNQGLGGVGGRDMPGMGNKKDFDIVRDVDVGFDDVAGIDAVRDEVSEIVEFVKNPKKFDRSGATTPRGCLLVGKPGTGKTLMAKAIASEAEVPFLATSASQYVELFVGMGAARIRRVFENARNNAPCILFIDEIDAIGKKRSGNISIAGGNDEREQTLNQLLTEMDGFENNAGVIVIAATNRREILDDALTRPGRFDRVVSLPLPDVDGREKILRVHAKNKTLADDVDLRAIARVTAGQSGAELKNVMNEAAIYAARNDRDSITNDDVNAAFEKALLGIPNGRRYTDEQRRVVAYHEAGHALVGMLVGDDDVGKISIVPRGSSGGVTVFVPDENAVDGWYTKSYLENKIKIGLGGHAAEDIVVGEVTTGAVSDFEQATNIARNMVAAFGFSELGKVSVDNGASDNTKTAVDREVRKILKNEYSAVVHLLVKNRTKLDALADMLMADGEVDGTRAKDALFDS